METFKWVGHLSKWKCLKYVLKSRCWLSLLKLILLIGWSIEFVTTCMIDLLALTCTAVYTGHLYPTPTRLSLSGSQARADTCRLWHCFSWHDEACSTAVGEALWTTLRERTGATSPGNSLNPGFNTLATLVSYLSLIILISRDPVRFVGWESVLCK